MNLSNLGDLAKQMQDAYSEGTSTMNTAGESVAEDINPDHQIEVNIKLSAKIEGHDYKVDSKIIFEIELEPFLGEGDDHTEELSKALEGLDVGDEKDAIMEQLGQPRVVGVVKKIDSKEIELSNAEGKVKADLNKKGTILLTIKDGKALVNFESVLSFPDNTDVFVVIPSMEKMQKNIVLDMKDLDKKITFDWVEKDKDGLKVEGDIQIEKI